MPIFNNQQPTCSDGVKNGNETGTDCGGTCATKCAPGGGCVGGSDCASGVCFGSVCQAVSAVWKRRGLAAWHAPGGRGEGRLGGG
jgi:hypothetical protein